MNILKKTLLGLTLALGTLGAAIAGPTVETNLFFLDVLPSSTPGDYSWSTGLSNTLGTTGDSFVDTYIVNTPPMTSLLGFLANASGVQFTGLTLESAAAAFGDPTQPSYSFGSVSLTDFDINAYGAMLDSGTYALVISGNVLADGGSYGGWLGTVPEPASIALTLAALMGAGLASRRRKADAQA